MHLGILPLSLHAPLILGLPSLLVSQSGICRAAAQLHSNQEGLELVDLSLHCRSARHVLHCKPFAFVYVSAHHVGHSTSAQVSGG